MDVSVVIPTWNRWPLLERAASAALGQRDVDHEVIVVDDGSTDGTAARAEAIGDPRLSVVRLPRNRGVAHARNVGLERASGRWVAFLDDDDIWAPFRLRRLMEFGEARDADLALSRTVVIDANGRVEAVDVVPEPPELYDAMRVTNAIGSPSGALIRREQARAVGGYDERFAVLADWDFWLRLLPHARVAISPEVLGAYVAHPAGMHARRATAAVDEFRVLRELHAVGRDGREIRSDEFMRWIGRAHRRAGRPLAGARTYLELAAETRRISDVGRALLALLGEGAVSALRRRRRRPPNPPGWLAAELASSRLLSWPAS